MHYERSPGSVMAVTDLAEFFRDSLRGVLAEQRVAVKEQTEQYVVNMLTVFARAEELYEPTPEGLSLKPLAQMLWEALEAGSASERDLALQRLGDVSLFVAGFFAHSFARRVVGIDYYVAMGRQAYDTLANSAAAGRRRALAQVFAELGAKFQPLVDALGEISDFAYVHTQRDILMLYETWLKTGSERARGLLRRLGIDAVPTALRAH